jgi:hypothetical protein
MHAHIIRPRASRSAFGPHTHTCAHKVNSVSHTVPSCSAAIAQTRSCSAGHTCNTVLQPGNVTMASNAHRLRGGQAMGERAAAVQCSAHSIVLGPVVLQDQWCSGSQHSWRWLTRVVLDAPTCPHALGCMQTNSASHTRPHKHRFSCNYLPLQKHCLWLCQHVDLLLCYSPHINPNTNTHISNQAPAPHTTRLPSGHAAMQKPRVKLRQHAHMLLYATALTPTQTATHTLTHTHTHMHLTPATSSTPRACHTILW